MIGDVLIRVAGKSAASDSGGALFPLFDLAQGPLVAGVFALIGIAVARWLPGVLAGPITIVALFVFGNSYVINGPTDHAWFRLTPFNPAFVDDGWRLQAFHIVFLLGLAAAIGAVALLRHGRTRRVGDWLEGGLAVAVIFGLLQVR